MAKAVGLANAFFVFYHSDRIGPLVQRYPLWRAFPGPPTLFFSAPQHGDHYHMAPHPQMGRSAFIEPSSYRSLYMKRMAAASWSLPPLFSWGIAVLNANYFVTSTGRARPRIHDLPSVDHVLRNGFAFEEFVLGLTDCSVATNYGDDQAFTAAIRVASQDTGWFRPNFILYVQYASNSGQRQVDWRPLPITLPQDEEVADDEEE